MSYKEMLMNRSDSKSEFDAEDDDFLDDDEIQIHEDDVEICFEGKYPEISFSERVHELIDQSIKKTLIFASKKDYKKVLIGGPWMIFYHYLVVQPWSKDFTTKESSRLKIVAWICLPGLYYRYYGKGLLRIIGDVAGHVVKVDYKTTLAKRGRFVRIAVVVDLKKPLVMFVGLDGVPQPFEYEGLPMVCYEYRRLSHTSETCPHKTQKVSIEVAGLTVDTNAAKKLVNEEQSLYSSWMHVNSWRKRVVAVDKERKLKNIRKVYNHQTTNNLLRNLIGQLWSWIVMRKVVNFIVQFIHICYQKPGEMTKVYRTAVYASPNGTKQKKLRPQLAALVHDPEKAWLLGENFNAIVSSDEHEGGSINRSRRLLARISGVEKALEKAPPNALIDLERDLKMKLNTVLTQEESLWYKKSKSKWLSKGDQDTRFFHLNTVKRRRANYITTLTLEDGVRCEDQAKLKHADMVFYSNLFAKDNYVNEAAVDQMMVVHQVMKAFCNFSGNGVSNEKLLYLLPNETVLVCSMVNNKGEWDMDVLKTMLPSSSTAYITAVNGE
ncbi:hypothetical protein J1N35_004745 [Gossypium stocksii]|uniref:DUF4283 domain-containing protein n=1 Tax=Gossypium stocksii TaxID=47602 RepID=A0A9D3WE20_9ROSI|nr:hypothetical protein J1N35_004745 [Gossypium stocksii]